MAAPTPSPNPKRRGLPAYVGRPDRGLTCGEMALAGEKQASVLCRPSMAARGGGSGRVGDGAAPGCQSGGNRAATDGRRKKKGCRGARGEVTAMADGSRAVVDVRGGERDGPLPPPPPPPWSRSSSEQEGELRASAGIGRRCHESESEEGKMTHQENRR